MFKKLISVTVALYFSLLSANADIVPTVSKSIKHYGVGVLKINKDFNVYTEANENSEYAAKFTLPVSKTAIVEDYRKKINPYIVNIPSKKLFFVTLYDMPENQWAQVYYNQNGKEVGWINVKTPSDFMTWKEFVYKYGKKNGLNIMRDVPASEFNLYSQDSEESQIIDEFTYPEFIALRIIRGNWMLITVVDAGKEYKTGWFRWRTDDGKLRVFPKMK